VLPDAAEPDDGLARHCIGFVQLVWGHLLFMDDDENGL
jgi:hypothetical protein